MRRSRFDRDWTKGSIIGNLLSLSWPVIISDGLRMIGPTIDLIWVGRLGTAAIAGVGIGGTVVMLLTMAKEGLNIGARAMIARFVGAGDREGATHVAQQAFVLSSIYAIVVIVAGLFLVEPLLAPFRLEADVVREATAYMRIMFLNQGVNGFMMLCEAIMQASGDTVTPMKINIIARSIHAVLDPFLIFGWWLFPFMGVSGAALSNVIGYTLGTSLALWFFFTGRTRLRLTFRGFRLDPNMLWRIVKIALPACVAHMERSTGRVLLLGIIARFGTVAVAAYSVTEKVERFLHLPCSALGRGAGVLVAQNLGAGQPERAVRSGWVAAGISESIMVALSLVIFLSPQTVAHIFTSEPDLVKVISAFLVIETVGYGLAGFHNVFSQSINLAGDTLPPMLVTLLQMWGVALPLAVFLPKITNLGVYSVPWALTAGMIVQVIAYTIYFGLGRWKRKRV